MGQELLLDFGDLLAAGKRFAAMADSMTATSVTFPRAGAVNCFAAIDRLQDRASDLASSLNQMDHVTSEVRTEMVTWDDAVGTRFPSPWAVDQAAPPPIVPGAPGASPEAGTAPPAPPGGYVQHPDGPRGAPVLVLPPDLVPPARAHGAGAS